MVPKDLNISLHFLQLFNDISHIVSVLGLLFDLGDILPDLNDIFIDGFDFGLYFHFDLIEEFHKFILGDLSDKVLLFLLPEEVGVSK